ncbi:uncharacterized protein LOC5514578 [Nematostella vectensis]|uniref:uncharacterized protein LOC5514578 n=1 Tax=Nematostella vectensis TaxID=45351 RepID=UPI002077202D|nr:uncharacterized protein LOC5514578 [Nematostella vectensis]
MKLLLCLFGVALMCFDTVKGITLGVCSGGGPCETADFKAVGCFEDQFINRSLPNYIYNERDPTHPTYGNRSIEWYNWNNWLPGFACRCAAKAKELGYDVFGVQFWGECWAGHKSQHNAKKHGSSDQCYGYSYQSCAPNERFCAGRNLTNFVFEIVDLSCSVAFEKVGCFRDHHHEGARPLANYVISDRDDSVSSWSGSSIDWINWDTYMPKFACRCAEKAQELGNTFFGTQFYGECWTSRDGPNTFGRDGRGTECTNRCYEDCRFEDHCMGKQYHNYVYRLAGQCEVHITESECQVENPSNRAFNELIYSATDPLNSKFYGVLYDSSSWDTFFPTFLCRCARIAKATGHTKIGVTNYGDCYAGGSLDHGDSSNCRQGDDSTSCTSGAKKCAGKDATSVFVYTVA